MTSSLTPFAKNIFVKDYPIRYAGCTFFSRMTIIVLANGQLWIHSPCEIDDDLRAEIERLGPVGYIVAPGNFHHLHVPSCRRAFPSAKTLVCPGVDEKRPDLVHDGVLGDEPDGGYSDEIDQVVLRGNRIIKEVTFYHRPSKTLVLVDSIELIGDRTPGTNWLLRFWWKYLLGMWNVARPAPEYQMGWKDRAEARGSMEKILEWDFDSVIISHGENIREDAKDVVRGAWSDILGSEAVQRNLDLAPRTRTPLSECCRWK